MKNEFVLAFNEVIEEKQLPREVVLDALKNAMVSAYRRAVNASNAQSIEADIDIETGKVIIRAEKEIVDVVQDERTEVTLEDAHKVDPETKIGDMVMVESTPKNFGRVAAQTARQVIQQRIREAEREAQLDHFSKQMGEIVSGVVQAVSNQGVTLGLDMKAEGSMPRNHQIPGERFRVHERVRALLLEVKSSPRGPQIILSRAHRNFLRRLLENEVPEIYHGLVEIRSISREPGQRSKVAVSALQTGVDPVGACVGMRGVRIQAIVNELNGEKIDVIEWNPDPAGYIAKALSPARVNGVYLNDHVRGTKTATVVVPEDQLSLAIGRDGQNARLAAKLTAWKIDIKSLPEAAADAIYRLQNDPAYATIAENEKDIVTQLEATLAKKAEGRPINPEEYQAMSQFVDRIERGLVRQREKEKAAEEEMQRIAQANVPEGAFEIPLEDLGISLRYTSLLGGMGYTTIGDLLLQMNLDPNVILSIDGIGPKAMQEIETAFANLSFPEPVSEEPEAEIAVQEVELAEPEEGAAVEAEILGEELEKAVPTPDLIVEEEKEAILETEKAEAIAEETLEQPEETVVGEIVEPEKEEEKPETVEEEEETVSFDELFALRPEVLDMVPPSDDDEFEDEEGDKKKKKKKKQRKFVEVEYDPDHDMMVVKKKHKRTDFDWDENW
ncbi:MAG: transcription termination/antitermination protein NusA [Anaerolineales bacterium]|nr:transcription termination/antitermination protein NusA [Anaerolineales bacterium]